MKQLAMNPGRLVKLSKSSQSQQKLGKVDKGLIKSLITRENQKGLSKVRKQLRRFARS